MTKLKISGLHNTLVIQIHMDDDSQVYISNLEELFQLFMSINISDVITIQSEIFLNQSPQISNNLL